MIEHNCGINQSILLKYCICQLSTDTVFSKKYINWMFPWILCINYFTEYIFEYL